MFENDFLKIQKLFSESMAYKQFKNKIVIDRSIAEFCNKKIKWNLKEVSDYIASKDSVFKIVELIEKNNSTKILNMGTGVGFSAFAAIYAIRNKIGKVTSVDHLKQFNKISEYNIRQAASVFKIPCQIQIQTTDLVSLKKSISKSIWDKLKKNKIITNFLSTNNRIQLIKKRYKCKQLLFTYDLTKIEDYDFLILDGPPILRIGSLIKGIERINNNGIILFEICVMELELLQKMGLGPFLKTSGKQLSCNFSSYPVYPVSWLRVTPEIKCCFL